MTRPTFRYHVVFADGTATQITTDGTAAHVLKHIEFDDWENDRPRRAVVALVRTEGAPS